MELSESSMSPISYIPSHIADIMRKNVFVDFGSFGSNLCLNICNNLSLYKWGILYDTVQFRISFISLKLSLLGSE